MNWRITPRVRIALTFVMLAAQAESAVLYVDHSATTTPPPDGLSWTTAFPNLQLALNTAQSDDEIWVASGTYVPSVPADPTDTDVRSVTFLLVPSVEIYGGFAGTESAREQRNLKANETILSCDLDGDDPLIMYPPELATTAFRNANCYTVVTGAGGPDTLIDGFTITGGQASVHPNANGGLIVAKSRGGGMYVDDGATPTVRNCSFTSNYGFTDGGALATRSAMLVENTSFALNYSTFDGGAVFTGSHGTPVSGATFRNVTFYKNFTPLQGGGLHVGLINSEVLIENARFLENDGGNAGGGILVAPSGSLVTIRNSLFLKNTAGSGGAIHVQDPGGHLKLYNLTIVDNTASAENGFGGGVSAFGGDPADLLIVDIRNTIFDNNHADIDFDVHSKGSGNDLSMNFSNWVDDPGAVTQSIPAGLGNRHLDPEFVNPTINNFHLTPTSRLIDEGDPLIGYAGQVDFDEEPRVIASPCSVIGRVDMGVDEVFYPPCWNLGTQCHGDANSDGAVNATDIGLWLPANGSMYGDANYDECADITRNGTVDSEDFTIMDDNYYTNPLSNCGCFAPWPP